MSVVIVTNELKYIPLTYHLIITASPFSRTPSDELALRIKIFGGRYHEVHAPSKTQLHTEMAVLTEKLNLPRKRYAGLRRQHPVENKA